MTGDSVAIFRNVAYFIYTARCNKRVTLLAKSNVSLGTIAIFSSNISNVTPQHNNSQIKKYIYGRCGSTTCFSLSRVNLALLQSFDWQWLSPFDDLFESCTISFSSTVNGAILVTEVSRASSTLVARSFRLRYIHLADNDNRRKKSLTLWFRRVERAEAAGGTAVEAAGDTAVEAADGTAVEATGGTAAEAVVARSELLLGPRTLSCISIVR